MKRSLVSVEAFLKDFGFSDAEIKEICCEKPKRKRGRPYIGDELNVIWKIEREKPHKNITIATISMCIKEDRKQTLQQLAERVSECKNRPVDECLEVLRGLLDRGELGYYSDTTLLWRAWLPGKEKNT